MLGEKMALRIFTEAENAADVIRIGLGLQQVDHYKGDEKKEQGEQRVSATGSKE